MTSWVTSAGSPYILAARSPAHSSLQDPSLSLASGAVPGGACFLRNPVPTQRYIYVAAEKSRKCPGQEGMIWRQIPALPTRCNASASSSVTPEGRRTGR